MKRFLYSILSLLIFVTSCEKDGDKLIVKEPGAPSDFGANSTEIVLTSDGTDALALTLFWNAGALPEVSDPSVALPDDLIELIMQFSASEDFGSYSEVYLKPDQTSLQFTGGELSQLLMKLGMTEVQQYNVYARLAVKMGTSYTYSDTLVLKITPYAVETGWMQIVNKTDVSDVLATLYCKDASPMLFEGFAVPAGGWYNCFFIGADGTQWGCNADWTAFSLVANSENNCWFAEPAGCQYVYADTENELWWHVDVPAINLDINGNSVELKYSKSAGGYSGTVTVGDNASISVTGTGARFDITTGTDAGITGIEYPFSLIPVGADGFELVNMSNPSSAFTIEKGGTYTITFNVHDYKWSLKEGAEEPPVVTYPESVSMFYYVKEASDKLGLACDMAKTAEDGIFEGFIWTDPDWGMNFSGFRFHADEMIYSSNGDGQYVLGEGGWNCWSSNTGMNYVVADFTTMTWSETKVTQVAVAGDFNSWSIESDRFTFNMETGKWEIECNISNVEWGIQFVLGDESNTWRWIYKDSEGDGTLSLQGDNYIPQVGRYKIELDLSNFTEPTYTMTLIE